MRLALVGLGGNSLCRPEERGTAQEHIKRIHETFSHLRGLAKKYQLVFVHGNGPEVGNLLIQQERSRKILPKMPLDVLDAMTQGQLGYWIEQAVEDILHKRAVTIITRVEVDKKDRAFKVPTKPIGPYYKKKIFRHMMREPEGWRRVVPSPKPLKIVDMHEIEALVKLGFIVIAGGGGGIPVVKKSGKYVGVEAVIDKDYVAQKLATQLRAEMLIFLTDVDHVYYNYGRKGQKPIKKLEIRDALRYLEENQFSEGSMKPKIEASIEFLKSGGKRVLITSPKKLNLALKGKIGTLME